MKTALVLILALLLLVIGLPLGMGDMGDCPMCTSAKTPFALGLCAGILSLLALSVLLSSTRFGLATEVRYRFLLSRSIYRPPRFA